MAWILRAVGDSTKQLDLVMARRALQILADPEHGCQLTEIPSGQRRIRPGRDIDGLVAAAEQLEGGDWLYVKLNPVPAAGLGGRAAKADDIVRRRWLLIDCDPIRPSGVSATEAEHVAAKGLADAVTAHLKALGWPDPVIMDSGNGWHVAYRIDLPNDTMSKAICARCLKALAAHFADFPGARVDPATSKATQDTKLPGSWARKGPNTPDRPHRQVQLYVAPEVLQVVPLELLRSLAGIKGGQAELPVAPAPAPTAALAPKPAVNGTNGTNGHAPTSPFKLKAGEDHTAYAKKALEAEAGRVAMSGQGERYKTLTSAAFNLGQLVAEGKLTGAEVESTLKTAAERAGLGSDPDCGLKKIEDTIRKQIAYAANQPRNRKMADRNLEPPKSAVAAVPKDKKVTFAADAVSPKGVEWLWPGRIPLAKLTTFAGLGGLGKTFVLTDIAARISRGLDWPDMAGECCEFPGRTLFVSGEDDADDTLVPRLIEANADLSKVHFLLGEIQDKFWLGDLETLDRAADELGDELRLVVIDPPTSYLSGIDDHKNAEIRSVLSPLKGWTARRRCAMVFNTHFNKATGTVDAAMRVMGSVAWVNAVRAAHCFAADPEDPERRYFCPMKMNLGKQKKGLAYRIVETHDDLAKVEWLGEIEETASEAVNQGSKSKPRGVVASEWLVERFREKQCWPSDELFRAARACGVSQNALYEAKSRLNLPKARKVSLENGNVEWQWWVPPDWARLRDDQPAEPKTEAF